MEVSLLRNYIDMYSMGWLPDAHAGFSSDGSAPDNGDNPPTADLIDAQENRVVERLGADATLISLSASQYWDTVGLFIV